MEDFPPAQKEEIMNNTRYSEIRKILKIIESVVKIILLLLKLLKSFN